MQGLFHSPCPEFKPPITDSTVIETRQKKDPGMMLLPVM